MSEQEVLYINDTPLTDLGLHVTAHPRWMGSAELEYSYTQIPGAVGGVLGAEASAQARGVGITARLDVATLTGRETAINAVHRALKGMLELRFADQPDKVLDAVCTGVEVTPESRLSFVEPGVSVSLSFVSPLAYKRDRWSRQVSFGATRTEVPLGDLPSAGTMIIMGLATNPTVTYRAASGESVQTMGFTITLAADDYLEIDLAKRTITKSVAGTRTRDDSLRTSGYFFNLDPAYGSPGWTDWPTLEVDDGTGLLLYERTWSS
jgi:phage-related protein